MQSFKSKGKRLSALLLFSALLIGTSGQVSAEETAGRLSGVAPARTTASVERGAAPDRGVRDRGTSPDDETVARTRGRGTVQDQEGARGRTNGAGKGRQTRRAEDGTVVTRDGRTESARTRRAEQSGGRDVYSRRGDDGYGDSRAGKGPKFCQNGVGHPVKGMAWCREKGFGRGYGDIWSNDRRIEDIIIGRPSRRSSSVGTGGLGDILGDVILGRLNARRLDLGASAPLVGRWMDRDGGNVLQVLSGRTPVAEFIDSNRDGRSDSVRLAGGR